MTTPGSGPRFQKNMPRWYVLVVFLVFVIPGALAGAVFGMIVGGFTGDASIRDTAVLAYTTIFGLVGALVGSAIGLAPALLIYFLFKASLAAKKSAGIGVSPK